LPAGAIVNLRKVRDVSRCGALVGDLLQGAERPELAPTAEGTAVSKSGTGQPARILRSTWTGVLKAYRGRPWARIVIHMPLRDPKSVKFFYAALRK
jgi:hypothetical protein